MSLLFLILIDNSVSFRTTEICFMSVFVTVGTTSFDELTELVTSEPILKILETKSYSSLLVQYGRGHHQVKECNTAGLKINGYRYKDSISGDITNADLVISHAGAGTCLEVLGARKPLVVVVNEKLMDNHQFELAKQLHQDGHLLYCTCSTLGSTLSEMDLQSLEPLPAPKTNKFGEDLTLHFQL
uniref:UDP-N-acetylglucosamine transferase subunit ALG13 n=1 Tax=Phallusia mammillata TaxID=59560 RepID=A0A6F9D729_9ASCI|nr:UDP-N-acetylglucosamine transferase subunit ALG13 homolog [Phallusia mammillata]